MYRRKRDPQLTAIAGNKRARAVAVAKLHRLGLEDNTYRKPPALCYSPHCTFLAENASLHAAQDGTCITSHGTCIAHHENLVVAILTIASFIPQCRLICC